MALYDPKTLKFKSFPGHKGRPGLVGGSAPRSSDIIIEDKTTNAHAKRFLKGRVASQEIVSTLSKTNTNKIKSYLQIGRVTPSALVYDVYMSPRPSGGWGHVTKLEFYENDSVKMYPNNNIEWRTTYKQEAQPIIDLLKGRGFSHITLPVWKDNKEQWVSVSLK